MGRHAIWILAACSLLASSLARSDTAVDPATLKAAQAYVGSTSAGDFSKYADLMIPVAINGLKSQRPDLSDHCVTAVAAGTQNMMSSNKDKILAAMAEAYAKHFTADELDELTAFNLSELGRDYGNVMKELLKEELQKPDVAQSFLEAMQKMAKDGVPSEDRVSAVATVLRMLKGRLPEKEISQLGQFYYNGVGRKLLEQNPAVLNETFQFEMTLLSGQGKQMWSDLTSNGSCP
jgi:hypothetical protein